VSKVCLCAFEYKVRFEEVCFAQHSPGLVASNAVVLTDRLVAIWRTRQKLSTSSFGANFRITD